MNGETETAPVPREAGTHVRTWLAWLGVAAIIGLGVAGHSPMRSVLAVVAVIALLLASALLVDESRTHRWGDRRPADLAPAESGARREQAAAQSLLSHTGRRLAQSGAIDGASVADRTACRFPGYRWALAVALATAALSQTWFRTGTVLAGGDIAPPVGTAWLGRLFEPWVWPGSSLGAPNGTVSLLPWAALDAGVHALGGSGALAQRCWLSFLVVGAALGAYWLLRVLGLAPSAATVGAFAYIYNPYVLSGVGVNDVYLAAMVLLVLWSAVVVSVGRATWRARWGLVVFVVSAPMAGFVYQNPPLLGLCLLGVAGAAAATVWLDQEATVRRLARFVGGAMGVLVVGSAYWVVPAILELHSVSGALTTAARWTWTEGRANLANGLWLNTQWGWAYPTYFPYERLFTAFPLSFVKYLLPAGAFVSIALARPRGGSSARRRAKLASGAALVSLFLIVFGTGTNPPGAIVFDPLYRLPLGWLLQEPGRFLMAAALAYAVMVAVAAAEAAERLACTRVMRRGPAMWWRWLRTIPGGLLLAVVLVISFPTVAGALTPRYGSQVPASHVEVPRYWERLASDLNRSSPQATIVVLPPDDFYQMPYRWGYYGNDGFIENLLSARVIDPSGQGYSVASAGLLRAVQQLAGALVAHRWRIAGDILSAIGADEVLVRGDVNANYPGRAIVPPRLLGAALRVDPQAQVVASFGPLSVYRMRRTDTLASPRIATVDSVAPDLAVLGALAKGTVLVSRPPLRGATSVLEPPPLTSWPVVDGALRVSMTEPAGWRFRLTMLPTLSTWPPAPGPLARPHLAAQGRAPDGAQRVELTVRLAANLAPDGAFHHGLWGALGNCDAVPGTAALAHLSARVLPSGGPGAASPALALRARADRACEADTLRWRRGPLLVGFDYRALAGAPGLCLWEVGPNTCLPTPPLPTGKGWHHELFETQPARRTTRLLLFVYATPPAPGRPALDEYANVLVTRLPGTGQPVLVGAPSGRAGPKPASSPVVVSAPHAASGPSTATGARLAVSTSGFGSPLVGPAGGSLVVADGLRDAWLFTGVPANPTIRYRWAGAFRDGWLVSGTVAVLALAALIDGVVPATNRRRRRQRR